MLEIPCKDGITQFIKFHDEHFKAEVFSSFVDKKSVKLWLPYNDMCLTCEVETTDPEYIAVANRFNKPNVIISEEIFDDDYIRVRSSNEIIFLFKQKSSPGVVIPDSCYIALKDRDDHVICKFWKSVTLSSTPSWHSTDGAHYYNQKSKKKILSAAEVFAVTVAESMYIDLPSIMLSYGEIFAITASKLGRNPYVKASLIWIERGFTKTQPVAKVPIEPYPKEDDD